MRILALMSPTEGATFAEIQPLLPDEERLAWKFYKQGLVRDFFMTDRVGTVIVIAEAESIDALRSRFAELPLVQHNLLHLELFELLPFTNWETLFDTNVQEFVRLANYSKS